MLAIFEKGLTLCCLFIFSFESHKKMYLCSLRSLYWYIGHELILTVPIDNLPRYNECFVLSLAVGKNDMMIQMVDKPNTAPVGQDQETLTFKALLYLDVAVHAQVYRLFCVVHIPLFSLVAPL